VITVHGLLLVDCSLAEPPYSRTRLTAPAFGGEKFSVRSIT